MTTYANPVVRGNAPDPSIVRVGDDFFLATSTFDYLPGVRIRHSTDLVNWRIIGAAVTRPTQYDREGLPGPVMLYAPSIRYHDGTFYVVCTNFVEGGGNFVVSTTDPAGEWSDARWIDTEAFDPSLLFDGDTCYYTRRTLAPRADGQLGAIVQAEIDPDNGVLLGPMREISPDYGGFCTNDIEGPHVYHIGEWYYLFSAEGSTWKGHLQSVARSGSPWGPYEPCPDNPVLTHRNRVGHPIQTVGHADLVEAPDGTWWVVTHGTRHESHGGFVYHHNLGRETFLAPVEWVDGWPVAGDRGRIELQMTTDRMLPAATSSIQAPDTLWTEGWSTIGLPSEEMQRDGARITVPSGLTLSDLRPDGLVPAHGVGALLRPQTEDSAHFQAVLESAGDGPAGIAVHSDARHHYRLTVSGEGATRTVTLRRQADDLVAVDEVALPGEGPVLLEVTADAQSYTFSADGVRIGAGSARLVSAETCEAFIGVHFALVAEGTAGSAVFADVSP